MINPKEQCLESSMDTFVIVAIALIVLLVACYLLSRGSSTGRSGCGSTTGTPCGPCATSSIAGQCFPGAEFHVKNGLFDFQDCTDPIYLLNIEPSQVHFLARR